MTTPVAWVHARALRLEPAIPLLGIVVLATLPALLASGAPVAVLGETCLHFLRLCFAALSQFDGILHVTPILLITAGLIRTAHRHAIPLRKSHVALYRLPHRRPYHGEPLERLAAEYGIRSRVRILTGPAPNPAFTAGLFRPHIYIATGLQYQINSEELRAVLLHEAHHLRRADPLRTFLLVFTADMFFWLPIVREAAADALSRIEFAADDAARSVGDTVLAGAILRIAEFSTSATGYAPAFAAPPMIRRRVERLLGERAAELTPRPGWRVVVMSGAVLGLLWFVGLASSGSHAAHASSEPTFCPHEHAHVVLHAH